MSASREKKERQNNPAAQELTERQKQELADAARAKRNTVVYTIIGVVVALLVAALLIWNSGIFQRNSTALTVKDTDYGPADVSFYYNSALSTMYEMATYGMSNFDATLDPAEQTIDANTVNYMSMFGYGQLTEGMTYHDYFLTNAIESLVQVTALYDAAQAAGHVLSAEGLQSVQDSIDSLTSSATTSGYTAEAYLQLVYGKYLTMDRYEELLTQNTIANEYATAVTETFGNYSDEELEAYYQANPDALDTYTFHMCYIDGTVASTTDAEGNTVEPTEEETAAALAAAKANAEAMLAAVQGGADFAEVAPDYVAEAEKTAYQTKGYTEVAVLGNNVTSSIYGEWLLSADRKAGDAELFEQEGYGYYVLQYVSRARVDDPTVNVRHILYLAEMDEGATEPTAEQLDAAKAKAEAVKAEWEAGDKTAESFGELANRDSDDPGSNTKGGLYSGVEEGTMFGEFNDWIFDAARQPGDVTLIENPQADQQGWHVVYFEGLEEPTWKSTAQTNKANDDSTAWYESVEEGYTAVEGSGMKYVG